MAITFNLPVREWYFDKTSIWTLDYPPLFAIFEFILALIARCLGLEAELALTPNQLRTNTIVVYQKFTVIACDLAYYYSVYKLCNTIDNLYAKNEKKSKEVNQTQRSRRQGLVESLERPSIASNIALFLLLQPCLLLVDHIHFQYNGFLSSIMLLSINSIILKNYGMASFWYATLISLKHIYLYCAPAYGSYVLSAYCFEKQPNIKTSFKTYVYTLFTKVFRLGLIITTTIGIIFIPFVRDMESLTQVMNRLFPFKRGLTHAYWAPNIWALYNLADKVSDRLLKPEPKARFDMDTITGTNFMKGPSSTSGLVQEYEHQYLPSITPLITFTLVGIFTIPIVIKVALNYGKWSPRLFLKTLSIVSFTSYLFGWHVHEKAILLVMLPMTIVALIDENLQNAFLRLTLVGTYSILPLLYKPAEYVTKVCIFGSYYCLSLALTSSKKSTERETNSSRVLAFWRKLYKQFDQLLLWAIILNEVYFVLIHRRLNYPWNLLAKLDRYEFLPLMTTSCISAMGVVSSYLEFYYFSLLTPVLDVEAV